VDRGRDLAEPVAVLTGVVGAEQKFSTGYELHPQVCLSATTVAAVGSVERSEGGNCSGHVGPLLRVGARAST
jgi:hypothetical protein